MRSTSRRSAAGRSWRLHLQRGGHVHRMCGTRPGLVPQALHLVCDEEKMLERILRRAQTEGRADDTRKAAVRRIAVYRQQSEPTLEWLRASRVPIVELDSSGSREEMWSGLKTTGSGRCRYLKNMPRRAKNGFREGTHAKKKESANQVDALNSLVFEVKVL